MRLLIRRIDASMTIKRRSASHFSGSSKLTGIMLMKALRLEATKTVVARGWRANGYQREDGVTRVLVLYIPKQTNKKAQRLSRSNIAIFTQTLKLVSNKLSGIRIALL